LAYENLGLVLVKQNKPVEAEAAFRKALEIEPDDADAAPSGVRYNAACAAALAGVGKGEDASSLDEKERARLRAQALDWLRADLTAWDKRRQDDSKGRLEIQQTLQHWLADPDLAGLRDADALAKLPEAEREPWRKLWADVDALLTKVGDSNQP
jgi:tetratricopeptide (TPR) repeat protein